MPEYFVDTWYFVASLDRGDAHHQEVRRLTQRYGRAALVTHDGVLTEVLAYFSGMGPRSREQASGQARDAMRVMRVVPASRDLFLSALDLYDRRADKEYSLVDCMSMRLMTARGITHIMTNDHHFRQEGFNILSDVQ
jgi:predicted nucleic acid-binding protein